MAVLLLLFYATASGYSAMIATKLEQLMCSQVIFLMLEQTQLVELVIYPQIIESSYILIPMLSYFRDTRIRFLELPPQLL